jgi:hypothetical protein
MTASRLNIACALISLLGSVLLLALNSALSAFIWLGASLAWVVLAAYYRGRSARVESSAVRIARRFSLLLLFS